MVCLASDPRNGTGYWRRPNAWINRTLLAFPLCVYIGLISYPLYLWHFSSSTVAERQEQGVSDNEGQCSCGSDASSPPLTCTPATASDTSRCGQGCKGYDTSHDTNFRSAPEACFRLPLPIFPSTRPSFQGTWYACADGMGDARLMKFLQPKERIIPGLWRVKT